MSHAEDCTVVSSIEITNYACCLLLFSELDKRIFIYLTIVGGSVLESVSSSIV